MRLPAKFVAPLLNWLYRAWCGSLRYTEINRAVIEDIVGQGKPVVISLWHDELFPVAYLKRDLKIVAVVSRSGDGELLTWALKGAGFETARGSSSRGGLNALLDAMRRMRGTDWCACITVDGPRGPRHKAKPGAVFLASCMGVPIVPVRLFMKRAKIFQSWDRFQLPLPFSRVTLVCGDAYTPQVNTHDSEAMQRECRALEARLEDLHV